MTTLAVLLSGMTARAQTPPATTPPPPATPAQAAPAEPVAPTIAIVGEEYRVEISGGGWFTMPSTVQYSDTETLTNTPANGTATTTVVNGTLVDFQRDLGLKNQTFAEGHITIKLAPKHKLRGEFIPIFYKQTATIATTFNFNGQTYTAGQSVASTFRWNQWKAAYEFDALTFDRGFVGGVIAASSIDVSGAMANSAQSGTASVNILMPGLGGIGRFYLSEKVSGTLDVMFFDLPGSATSTHAHSLDIDGYAMYNLNKHVGVQIGYRLFDASHVWSSPLNTGSLTIKGPYVGGTARF